MLQIDPCVALADLSRGGTSPADAGGTIENLYALLTNVRITPPATAATVTTDVAALTTIFSSPHCATRPIPKRGAAGGAADDLRFDHQRHQACQDTGGR